MMTMSTVTLNEIGSEIMNQDKTENNNSPTDQNGRAWSEPEEDWKYWYAEGKLELIETLDGDELIIDELFVTGINAEGVGG